MALKRAQTTSPIDELDDVTLARARRGDPDALRSLINAYRGPVGALLFRMLVIDPSAVEDLAQETFVRVVQAISRFEPTGPAKLSTWILTIATRVAIDRLRRRTMERATPEGLLGLVSGAPSPEREAIARSLAERVQTEMTHLAPEQRAALVLRAYHDLDYNEIAEIQAVEVGTVKSRINRARTALRRAMEETS